MWPFKKKPKRVVSDLRDMIAAAEKRGDTRMANVLVKAVSEILRLDTTTGRVDGAGFPNSGR